MCRPHQNHQTIPLQTLICHARKGQLTFRVTKKQCCHKTGRIEQYNSLCMLQHKHDLLLETRSPSPIKYPLTIIPSSNFTVGTTHSISSETLPVVQSSLTACFTTHYLMAVIIPSDRSLMSSCLDIGNYFIKLQMHRPCANVDEYSSFFFGYMLHTQQHTLHVQQISHHMTVPYIKSVSS